MKILTRLFPALAALLCLFAVTTAFAGNPEIPRISIDELKKLMDAKTDIVVLDVQPKSVYNKGHIKGALSLPWKAEVTEPEVETLVKDKLTVTYCDCGPGEADSANLAAQLIVFGFTSVKVLSDPSIRGWKKAGYSVE